MPGEPVAFVWPVLDKDKLLELEQTLCYCRIRKTIAEGQSGVPQALGRLCKKVLDFIIKRCGGKSAQLTDTLLSLVHADDGTVTKQKLNKFLAGGIEDEDWVQHAERIFVFMLGDAGKTDPVTESIRVRMHAYFFRKRAGGQLAFLSPSRLSYDVPCSMTELAGEIGWHVRHAAQNRQRHGPTRIVFASGGPAFPFRSGVEKYWVAEQVIDAIENSIEVTCIYGSESVPAARSVRELEAQHKPLKGKINRIVPKERDESNATFLCPIFMMVFIQHGPGYEQALLLFVRMLPASDEADGGTAYIEPLAFAATPAERAAFVQWLKSISPVSARPAG